MLHQEFKAIGAPCTVAPPHGSLACPLLDYLYCLAHDLALFVTGQVARDLMMIPVASDLVASLGDRLDRFRIAFSNATAGEKRRLHPSLVQDSKNSPDPGLGTVFTLGPFLVVDLSVFVRLHVLATLKVKREHDGHPISIRPA